MPTANDPHRTTLSSGPTTVNAIVELIDRGPESLAVSRPGRPGLAVASGGSVPIQAPMRFPDGSGAPVNTTVPRTT